MTADSVDGAAPPDGGRLYCGFGLVFRIVPPVLIPAELSSGVLKLHRVPFSMLPVRQQVTQQVDSAQQSDPVRSGLKPVLNCAVSHVLLAVTPAITVRFDTFFSLSVHRTEREPSVMIECW